MKSGYSQHEKRKNEIIDCAARLFFQESYEATSVQKIIDTLGIAKGTFYYYFKSKIDLLNQFASRKSRSILDQLDAVVARKDINTVDKFNTYFDIAMSWKVENWDLILIYIKHSGLNENSIVYKTLLESNIQTALPSLLIMIQEGIDQGYFHTDFPDLVSEAIFRFGAAITDQLRPLILASKSKREGFDCFIRIMEFYQDTIEKMLGADKGLFKIFDSEKLEKIYHDSSSSDEGGKY